MATPTDAGPDPARPSAKMPAHAEPVYRGRKSKPPCDLVMKGGITSGVVYPAAVLELAQSYRFRKIGGASAGAIVAAATAAAEFAGDNGGFTRLKSVSDELVRPGLLRGLFQPTRDTRKLFDFLMELHDATAGGRSATPVLFRLAFGRALVLFLASFVLVIAILVAVDGWLGTSSLRGSDLAWRILLVLSAPLLFSMIVTPITFLKQAERFRRAIESHDLGMCPGLATTGGEALTEFLHRKLNELAGLPPADPLTFGHLRGQGVELALMTSNLSLQRPYRFPLPEGEVYFFKAQEMKRFFPPDVVAALTKGAANRVEREPGLAAYPIGPGEDVHLLPHELDLPVVVAVRVSLSFPLLFSAVPLYTLTQAYFDRVARGEARTVRDADLHRHYFSDGGIVSNFPVHMFDRWLPSAPTFGINLAGVPARPGVPSDPKTGIDPWFLSRTVLARPVGNRPVQAQVEPGQGRPELDPVYLPRADAEPTDEWAAVDSLAGLAGAVFYTAKNHRDHQQARLPGFKERVVTVRLREDQGGLNLDMPPDVIQQVIDLGKRAGETLRGARFNFVHHKWVRFQVVLAQLERELRIMRETFEDKSWATLVAGVTADYPFIRPEEWRRLAIAAVNELEQTLSPWLGRANAFFDDALIPLPQPEKRLVPRE
ncbi:MAG TPA: patatin-like phospholipase family protein [Gemmataceae bacterium]|nr:patatin-like phospholipase family protein [Gemmataceae bacterium]